MARMNAWIVGCLVVVAAAAGCNRPDEALCQQACRQFNKLAYWEKAELEIAKAPAEARDAMRQDKQKAFDTQATEGLTHCVMACKSANSEGQSKCILASQTLAAAQKCE